MAKKKLKMKLTHKTHSWGGPWSSTDFAVNGVPIGTLRTKSRSVRDTEIARFEKMTQEQLRALLRNRVGTMVSAIKEVVDLLENFQNTGEEVLKML